MIGIENVNEFYTTHYLEAILRGDLKKTVFREWSDAARETDERPPHQKLRRLSADFFEFRAELQREEDPQERRALHHRFAAHLLHALGYDPQPRSHTVEDGTIPTIADVHRPDGAPLLWAIQATDTVADAPEDPLNLAIYHDSAEQSGAATRHENPSPALTGEVAASQSARDSGSRERSMGHPRKPTEGASDPATIADLISQKIFTRTEPPRFILVVGQSHLLLIDRSKWMEKRLLRFDLTEILGRKGAFRLSGLHVRDLALDLLAFLLITLVETLENVQLLGIAQADVDGGQGHDDGPSLILVDECRHRGMMPSDGS